jgi:hypothetical protein
MLDAGITHDQKVVLREPGSLSSWHRFNPSNLLTEIYCSVAVLVPRNEVSSLAIATDDARHSTEFA